MLGAYMDVDSYLERVRKEVERLDRGEIEALADAIYERYQTGRFVFIIGNGGDDALHYDVAFSYEEGRPALSQVNLRLKP